MADRAEMTRRRNERAWRSLERRVKAREARKVTHELPEGYEFSAEDGAVVRSVSPELAELAELASAL